MSFPNPNSFASPPFTTGDAHYYWASFAIPTNAQPDLNPQSVTYSSDKIQKLSENPLNLARFPPMDPRTNPSNVSVNITIPTNNQPDLSRQFDNNPFKRQKTSETQANLSQLPLMKPRTNPSSIPGNRGTSHIFYKTRICMRFLEGTCCRNSDQCTFAHGPEDLREPPCNWQELVREKDWGGGNNSSSMGGEHKATHRMKICNKYYNGEECPYGDRCTFVHESAPGHLSDESGRRQSSAVRLGVAEEARRIGVDVNQTTPWKTKICAKWEMGQCPYRERCTFAHGFSDLKPSSAAEEVASSSIPIMAHSVASFNATPSNVAASATPNASKWKLTKRINRIYGDWFDDGSPPRNSSFAEEG